MRAFAFAFAFALSLFTLGCTAEPDPNDTTGFEDIDTSEEGSCNVTVEEEYALDVATPLNLSGADVLFRTERTHPSALVYPDDSSVQLDVTLSYDGGIVTYYEREIEGAVDATLSSWCSDSVEVEAIVELESADGAFSESFDILLKSRLKDLSWWSHTLDVGELGGDYVFTEVDPAEFDVLTVTFEGEFDLDGSGGTIHAVGESSDGDTASATLIEVADWRPPVTGG